MIHPDKRETEQLLKLMRELTPLLECEDIGYSWDYYLKNNTKGKKGVHWEYTKMELIGYKEEELYFKFSNGFTRPLSYNELKTTYVLKK